MLEQQGTEQKESNETSGLLEADLEQIVDTRISDIAWTKAVLFRMAEKKKKYSHINKGLIIIVTGGLTVSLIVELLSLQMYTALAVLVSVLSFVDIATDWEGDYYESLIAAESYNSLLKKFEEYHAITLKDENIDITEKKHRLRDLTEKHRQLNKTTTETDPDIYEELIENNVDVPGDRTYDYFQSTEK